MKANRRAWFVAGIVLGFGVLLLVTVAAQALLPSPLEPERIFWVDFENIPAEACPGHVIKYRSAVLVVGMQRGGALWVSRTIRRADDNVVVAQLRDDPAVRRLVETYDAELIGDTVVPQPIGAMLLLNIPPGAPRRMLIDLESGFTVPDLAPGKYERVLASGQLYVNVRHAIRIQPFAVPERCE